MIVGKKTVILFVDNWAHFIACDDARIKVWDIPNGGLTETLTQPKFSLTGMQYYAVIIITKNLCRTLWET